MGRSENSSQSFGTVLEGKYNHYRLLNKLGKGGNGTVYSVLVVEPIVQLPTVINGYAIKKLTTFKEQQKREKRFVKEILTVLKLQDGIDGIIPIYDYSFCEGDGNTLWYLMPQAETYDYFKYSDIENLLYLRSLGNTIAQLHGLDYAHRDIKPDNILFYDKKPCLSDFGLVWDCYDNQKLTSTGEGVGPNNIRPPELDRYSDRIDNFDFRVSDVYLFAKTLWIILTKRKNCFKGEYSRGNSISSLNNHLPNLGETLEPLHILLEKATKDDFRNRITINDCLDLIDVQISIFNKSIPQDEINGYKYNERIGTARAINEADDLVFRDDTKMLDICKELQGAADLVVNYGFKTLNLGGLRQVQYLSNHIFIFSIKGLIPKIEIYVSLDSITIGENNKCSCKLSRFDELPAGIKILNDINELDYASDHKYALDVELEMSFVHS